MDYNPLPTLPTYLLEPNLAGLLSLVLTLVLPVAAALFMRSSWSASTKGLVLLGASALKTMLEAWLAALNDGYALDWWPLFYSTLLNLAIAVAGFYGLGIRGSSPQQAALHGGPVHDRVESKHVDH